MFETELASNAVLLSLAEQLTADIADADLTAQPVAGTNHPAWILGHLAYAADGAVGLLGGEKQTDAQWSTKYGRDSKLSSARTDYPSRDELLRVFLETHRRARELASTADAERMKRANPNSRMRDRLPTIGEMCAFLLTGHLGFHLGQLSAWRRMRGLPPLF